MITEDPQLEARLRAHGTSLKQEARVTPTLHARIMERASQSSPTAKRRILPQLAAVAAMLLVAIGAVALLIKVRSNELARATPVVKGVSPADGSKDVPLAGEFRIQFASRPAAMPAVRHQPADGTQQPGQWSGTTLVVKYAALHPNTQYQVFLTSDYTSSLGGHGQLEKRWAFTTEPGAPPANTALIWYETPSPSEGSAQGQPSTYRLNALGWDGRLLGILHASGGIQQSPDGTRLFLLGAGITDQAGNPLGSLQSDKGGPTWADDSRHLCQMLTASGGPSSGSGEPAWLYTAAVGSPLHRVVQVGQYGGQSGASVIACSYESDRAVVVENVIAWVSDVWVYRLSTGVLLYHHAYAGSAASSVVASHDGRYLAEVGASETVIRRTMDGVVMARLAGQSVCGFSWDGSRVVTSPPFGSTAPGEVRLVDWQHGTVVWRMALSKSGSDVVVLPNPGGTSLVVGVGSVNAQGVVQMDQLWLVTADGAARQVAKGPIFTGF